MGLVASAHVFGFPKKRVSNQSPQLQRLARNGNFTCNKFTYDAFQKVNYMDADQTAWMCRLVCACVIHKHPKTGFLTRRLKCKHAFAYTFEPEIFDSEGFFMIHIQNMC